MTTTQLVLFGLVYLAGIVYGAHVGKTKGSTRLGIICTLLLGPAFGILLLWAIKGGPVNVTSPVNQPPTQP